jgi:ABC-2 type transport system ATP-binding protein
MTSSTNSRANPASGIALAGLHKSFRTPEGPVQAVRGVDLTIAPGETVALLGPNGAGKSTTIDMMLGLTQPDAGSVTLFGLTPAQAIKQGAIGAMLQTGAVLRDLSVRELLTMMGSLFPRPFTVDEVLELTQLGDIANRMTHKLSGGQSQRVRFAVALISNPDLLVLDEPTVAMDVEARRDFWAAMRQFTDQGKTVVFATHYLEEADAYSDRIVLMSHGRVVADGPANEIKATVGGRTIRATLVGIDLDALTGLAGVSSAEQRGEAVVLRCADSDLAIRALLAEYPGARDIEITGAGLEEAFLQLTGDDESADTATADNSATTTGVVA